MRSRRRVLFIERNLRNEKLGIMYLAGALKAQGHHADLIQTDKEDLDEKIREYRPDFVAFSITTGEHIHALKLAREIKERYGIPNIFGGPHCTFFPEVAYEPDVDFIIQGQGERAIVDVVEDRLAPGFYKAEMPFRLDDLALPDRDILYQHGEFRENPMKNVITSRACPNRCSYCFNHSQLALTRIDGETKRWFNRRSIDNVICEINGLRDRYPVEKLLFIDDTFIQSSSWLDAFLSGYTDRVRLPWLCSLRVNNLDEKLAERMFTSGLEMVAYALESADPDVQQRLLHRGRITNGDVISAIRLFNRFGIRARMYNMIGLPLANPLEDALNTLQFNMRHQVTDSWCAIFHPYPRTALGQYCVDHGYVKAETPNHCSESFFDESRLDIPNRGELYALQKLWYFIVAADLPLDLVQILIRGDFTPEIGEQLQRLRFQCSRSKLYGLDDADSQAAVDPQSRECRASSQRGESTAAAGTAPLIRAVFRDTTLPDRFVDILTQIWFAAREQNDLARYLEGERIYAPPVCTIDDETGELADPAVSIYRRGTPDPDGSDIRNMPEEYFMRGMVEVRNELAVHHPSRGLQARAVL